MNEDRLRCRIAGHEWGPWIRRAVAPKDAPLLRYDDVRARQLAPVRSIKTVRARLCAHCEEVETVDD